MSWAEVKKINSNMQIPLNEQIANSFFSQADYITTSQTWEAPRDGVYKIIVVGAGGKSYASSSGAYGGGAGGIAIKTLTMEEGDSHTITIGSNDVAFDNIVANDGGDATASRSGTGGTASGGDFNFTGNNGRYNSDGASVGCFIPSLCNKTDYIYSISGNVYSIESGWGIMGLGYSGGTLTNSNGSRVQPSAPGGVIIQLIELR